MVNYKYEIWSFHFLFQKQTADVREEDPETRVMRMLQFLRVMKYKPKTDGGNV